MSQFKTRRRGDAAETASTKNRNRLDRARPHTRTRRRPRSLAFSNHASLGTAKTGSLIEAPIRVSHPSDHEEKEADRQANRAMRLLEIELGDALAGDGLQASDSWNSRLPGGIVHVRSKPDQVTNDQPTAAVRETADLVRARRLESNLTRIVEAVTGESLGSARVHSDRDAATLARALHARAYTIGNDVGLSAETQQASGLGRARVLAHEFVHVAQERRKSRAGSAVLIRRQTQPHVTHAGPIVVTMPHRQYVQTLRSAGWRQVDVIMAVHDYNHGMFTGEIWAGFHAPGVVTQWTAGPGVVHQGSVMWTGMWLKPVGTVSIYGIRFGTHPPIVQVAPYRLPRRGPLVFDVTQDHQEITVTAVSSAAAANQVGAKGTMGVDFEVFEVGGEVSQSTTTTRGQSLSKSYKVILPKNTFTIRQVP